VPDINNLGKLLSLEWQLPTPQTDGVLAQFPHRWMEFQRVGEQSWHASEQCSWAFDLQTISPVAPKSKKPTSLTCLLGNEVLSTYDKPSHKPRTFRWAASDSLSRSAATLLVITSKLSVLSIGFVGLRNNFMRPKINQLEADR
jgi:hypothetical protein